MTLPAPPRHGRFSAGLRPVLAALLFASLPACSPRNPEPAAATVETIPVPPEIPVQTLDPSLADLIQKRRERVSAQPSEGRAWGELAQAFHAAEFPREAATCYQHAARLDPQQPRWFHLLALLQLADAPQLALTQFTNALKLAPSLEAPRLRLARALIERGRYPEAAAHLDRVLAGQPEHPAARLELARIRLALSQPGEAEQLLAPCLTNPYTAKSAMLLKGQARQRLGDTSEATLWAERAAALPKPFDWPDPDLRAVQDLRRDRGRRAEQILALLQARRFDEADHQVQHLLSEVPEDAEGLLLLGRLRLQQRRLAEADAALVRHLAVWPDSLAGWVQLGMARYAQTQWISAAAAFSNALQLKPDFVPAHVNRGLALSRSGQRAAAEASLREALRLDPADLGALYALADELARAAQFAEARSLLSQLLARDPTHARATALLQRLPPSPPDVAPP